MSKREMNPKVDDYVSRAENWKTEFETLRMVALDCGLVEDLKWGHPCYTLNNKNVVLIHGFKEYCALLFFKGVLLKDTDNLLIQQTENVQAGRQIRFTNVQQINEKESTIKEYIKEAAAVEEAGLEVNVEKKEEIPEELQTKFNEIKGLKAAFEDLTPGRQRAYILYFAKAKRSETRVSRIEKYVKHIMDGKGLNDK